MSTEFPPDDIMPDRNKVPPSRPVGSEPDESYWSALLKEAESKYSDPPVPNNHNGGWKERDFHQALSSSLYDAAPRATESDWTQARSTYFNDQAVKLIVTGYNRGGLLVTWNSLRGFVPASQLVDFPVDVSENTRRELLAKYIGRLLDLRIIELDIDSNRLILSERAAGVQPGQRASVLKSLKAGTICEGNVTNLCDFGAFVDLGGIEGLIHISELSWGRVGHPRDVLSSGEKVKVYIMEVDPSDERIALSLKRLLPDPWASVENKYEVGQTVEGVITNVVDFGAFACIEEGLEGLIHISELAEGQFLHPRNVVREGDKVMARILNIDGSARRLGLSLRQEDGFARPFENTNRPNTGDNDRPNRNDPFNSIKNSP